MAKNLIYALRHEARHGNFDALKRIAHHQRDKKDVKKFSKLF